MIHFLCSSCGFTRDVPDNLGGKKVACPKCKTPNEISGTIPLVATPKIAAQPTAESTPPIQNDSPLLVREPANNDLLKMAIVALSSIIVTAMVCGTLYFLFAASGGATENGKAVKLTGSAKSKVLATLRKMESYTETGISYREYSSKILDINAELVEALENVQDDKFVSGVQNIMQVYKDAMTYWSFAIKFDGNSIGETNLYTMADYSKLERLRLTFITFDTSDIPTYWKIASSKTKELDK